jgi:arogenate dehydrogenase (NADP+), plant
VKVLALDAAMPFDFESRAAEKIKAEKSLMIGIVGFGTFGQFLAKRIVKQGHQVDSAPGHACVTLMKA